MKLYHGTTKNNAEQILKDNSIKINCPSVWDTFPEESHTTKGYIYLATDRFYAYKYAQLLAQQNKEDFCCVFEINVDDSYLEVDMDELIHVHEREYKKRGQKPWNLQQSLTISKAVRTKKELGIGTEVLALATLPIWSNIQPENTKNSVKRCMSNNCPSEEVKDEDELNFDSIAIFQPCYAN